MAKVLHASYSGYFPFCIYEATEDEVGYQTNYPVSMPLEKIMEVFWRVKQVKGIAPTEILDSSVVTYYKTTSSSSAFINPETEEFIACAHGGIHLNAYNQAWPGPGFFNNIVCHFCSSPVGRNILLHNGSYYPYLGIYCFQYIPPGQPNNVYFGILGSFYTINDPNNYSIGGVLNFFGQDIDLYKFDPPFAPTSFLPFSGSISASSYWPYQ